MRPIPFQFLSASLLTVGAVIALWGVLSIKPPEVINSSIIWDDDPGVIRALFNPSKISEYIQQRNKAVFALALVIIGFILGLPWFDKFCMAPKILPYFIFFLLVLAVVVPGTTRQKVLTGWKESKFQWFLTLLDENEFRKKNEEWKARGQENDNLKDMVVFLGHITESLNITVDTPKTSKPTFEELNKNRRVIKADIDNRSLFYYLLRPNKLYWAYK